MVEWAMLNTLPTVFDHQTHSLNKQIRVAMKQELLGQLLRGVDERQLPKLMRLFHMLVSQELKDCALDLKEREIQMKEEKMCREIEAEEAAKKQAATSTNADADDPPTNVEDENDPNYKTNKHSPRRMREGLKRMFADAAAAEAHEAKTTKRAAADQLTSTP